MPVDDDIEVWRLVLEHWRGEGRDLRHLEIPPELAPQLGVPLDVTKERRRDIETEDEEDDMAKKNGKTTTTKKVGGKKKATKPRPKTTSAAPAPAPTPVATSAGFEPQPQPQPAAQPTAQEPAGISAAAGEKKWKKRSSFEGDHCGFSGCAKKADGYVQGVRSTKEGERDARGTWFGPACVGCAGKFNAVPMSLSALANAYRGASNLANVLDIEVGEVLKRLAAANIDENGQSLTSEVVQGVPAGAVQLPQLQQVPVPQQPVGTALAPPAPAAPLAVAREEHYNVAVVVPYDIIAATRQEMANTGHALLSFVIRSQPDMDYASSYVQRVKGLWNQLDELRKSMARPFKAIVDQIQENFKPVLTDLEKVEQAIKDKINEAMAWSASSQQAGFQAANVALAQGDTQGVAVATQQAVAADLSLSKGISMRAKICFEIVDPSQIPGQLWSPDDKKIQAHLDGMDREQLTQLLNSGFTPIPGVRVWQDNTVAARAAAA